MKKHGSEVAQENAEIEKLALSLFRVVYGEGDAGSKFAFHSQNPCWIQGWWKLAKRFLDAAARVEPATVDSITEADLAHILGVTEQKLANRLSDAVKLLEEYWIELDAPLQGALRTRIVEFARRANASLGATPPAPGLPDKEESSPWIRTAERAPTEKDGDDLGDVFAIRFQPNGQIEKPKFRHWSGVVEFAHLYQLWMPIPPLPASLPTKPTKQ